ncbi:sigma factor-like helix-turn-helix DNA-binding protein [Brevibacillus laterosporus]|uniref:sigma factor-like helix-turn-helix DNA-binding protein n=1 Tax=Brevibacillus laterosporus TaxID=1465 RepID=UPI000E6B6759|nr:sigma factor-like helix-turn-helix DNA-binding protein [Brevibacillus laterosporus]AYB36946.1 RNA polymerase subunit sigma-70 [Brevibacillus laterosporus]NKQ19905.1 RNA polymerase subunit sigma-70 [Brevibacillus laterosporus]WNX30259.1 sigma factor-like helix-turn-helix DNA-binding protein [Brevibacillus laterosporus]
MTRNMKKLITSYKATKKQLKSMLAQVTNSDQRASADCVHGTDQEALRSSLAASIRDVEYAILWLETGRQPDNQRGIERRSKEQREILLDPFKMQSYVTPGTGGCRVGVSDAERDLIDFYLQFVTEKERECYLMVHGSGFTHEKAAEMLFLSRGNISTLLSRAQQKIEFAKNLTAILAMAVFFLISRGAKTLNYERLFAWGRSHL